jgi:DNA ligase (NAD+)
MRSFRRDELRESQIKSGIGASRSSALRDGPWECPNPDCPAQVRRALLHWCSPDAMDIPSCDVAMVAQLVSTGLVRDVAELYRLKVKELAALPGMDKSSAQKLFDAVSISMKRDAWRLLFGLGIPLVGAVFAAGVPRLMKDAGVSEAVAQGLVRWHSDGVNRKLVNRLFKSGVNFKSELYQTSVSNKT